MNNKNDISPQACITILEKTGGIPAEIIKEATNLKNEEKRLENINNRFVREKIKKIDSISQKFPIPDFREQLINWLKYFPEFEDKLLALKLVNFTTYYSRKTIIEYLYNGYQKIKEQVSPHDDWKEIILCQAGEIGKSGGLLLYNLRRKANLVPSQCCSIKDLGDSRCIDSKAVVFVDDFIGTGNQCINLWNETYTLKKDLKQYFLVVSGIESGVKNAQMNTGFEIICGDILGEEKKLFSEKNTFFTNEEKERLFSISQRIGGKAYLGYRKSQVCVAFEHTTPNNTITLLSGDSNTKGLFPRGGY